MKQNRWRWKNVTARHLTTREGHWNSGAGVRLVDRAAHFKQEVTRGGQTGSVRQSGDVVPLCFLSRPFPFPRSPWRHARPREEGERKGSEKVRERRAFWGIPPPPPHLHSSTLSTLNLSKCWLKSMSLIAVWASECCDAQERLDPDTSDCDAASCRQMFRVL